MSRVTASRSDLPIAPGEDDPPEPVVYTPRPIRYLGLWTHLGWRMKLFGISADGLLPRAQLIEDAKLAAASCVPDSATAYGVGWVIVHQARGLDAALVDWWFDDNIVQHHVFGRAQGAPGPLIYGWPPGAGFCVWEMAVCWWEREAWVAEVLRKGGPCAENLDRYLVCIREGEV